MLRYIIRRLLLVLPTLVVVSLVAYIVIELPPGDYLSSYIAQLKLSGEEVSREELKNLEIRYGLNQPVWVRYFKWLWNILRGDMGYSLEWNMPVRGLIGEPLALTFVVSLSTLLFTWLLALPIGVYSATHQYSIPDYLLTFLGFVGLGVPNFLLALVLIWIAFSQFGITLGGLFSLEYVDAPWSPAKVWDLCKHLAVPLIVLGTSGTAGLIRTMRANLLDQLNRPYVVTARAKGLTERQLLWKYPVRVALNPFVSSLGWALPGLVSGATIVSIVLSLPTTGPLLLAALLSQDMQLAASFIMMLSLLTIIGTLISDILLAWIDPRIRYAQ